ncbi:MAG: M23 family metallopeptidase [Desulfobacterales bacterium]|nr:M23 family metallopeptidase [Desulfobacterales bacterium]
MAANKFKLPKLLYVLIALFLCGLAIPLVRMIVMRLEGEMPVFQLESPIHDIGTSYTLKGWASDQESGLRRVWIAILQQGKERVLFDRAFPSRGFFGGGEVQNQLVSLEINVDALGLSDGDALLRTAVWDYSYRGWWTGNPAYAEHKILIDTQPPTIDVVSRTHNLNQGGAGLAVYRVSEPGTVNGVQAGDSFFPGYAGFFSDPNLYIAFFAIPYDEGPESRLYVRATDPAGNTWKTGFAHHINPRYFKQDNIIISDAFLRQKMPEFEHALNTAKPSASLLDKFIEVNLDLRQANNTTVKNVCKKSEAKLYWEGPFLRLPGSARKAGFADHRKYRYNGKIVDEQVHLGIDLASTAHSPVPAANNGRVAFAEYLGIYGKTVLLDHGFGLFSMYAHLSQIKVARGQVVSKGDVIGFTGTTGLAGGDHLHYAMIVGHTFVNPVEWWDPNWIKHNVTDKLKKIVTTQVQSSGVHGSRFSKQPLNR